MGWPGYLDPCYFHTSIVTKYADVYSFGIFMMVLLIGKPGMGPQSDVRFINIRRYVRVFQETGETIYQVRVREISVSERLKMDVFVELAFRCCERSIENRPKMIEVAKELKTIERSIVATSSIELV